MPVNNKAVKSPWAKHSRPRDSWEGDTRCLYPPRTRAGFFSATQFPTNGLLGNSPAYARIPIRCRGVGKRAYSSSFLVGGFSETRLTLRAKVDRHLPKPAESREALPTL